MALTTELVAFCERPDPDPGPKDGSLNYNDSDYKAAAECVLSQAPKGPLWIFAMGR